MSASSKILLFLKQWREKISFQLIVALVLTIMVLLPIVSLIYNSFTSTGFLHRTGFTLVNYEEAYTDPDFIPLLLNSFIFAIGSTVFAIIIGTFFAWIVTRTDTPLGGLAEFVPIFPMLFPPVVKNIAWIYLIAPRSGILNNFFREIFVTDATFFNAFSMPGMIWVYGMTSVPIAYLMMVSVFQQVDSSLEEASFMSGAGTLRTMSKITLPLLLPAIISSFLFIFVRSLGAFGTPVLQGIPGGIYVFTSKIYDAVSIKYNPALATAYSVILMVITMSFMGVYVYITKKSERFATIRGKGYYQKITNLGKWRYLTLFIFVAYFVLATIIPTIVITIVSITKYFTYDVFKNFTKYFTLNNYFTVFNHPTFKSAMVNSLLLGLISSVIILIPIAMLAQLIHKDDKNINKIFEFTSTLPSAMPQLLLGLGLLGVYIGTPLFLSVWGILVCYIIMFIPYTLRVFSAAIIQIHKELEEAATVHGSSWFYTFRRILLPLLKPTIIASFFYMFIQVQRVLGSVILITGPGLQLGPTVVFGYYRVGQWGECSASALILAALILSYIMISRYVFKVKLKF